MSARNSLVRQRVSDAISLWRRNQRPDARRFIDQHPEVKSVHSLVIDLAYEEYCLRQESGERLDTERFVANFPTVQHSLARMLDVHGVMGKQAGSIDSETDWPEAGSHWLDWELIEPIGRGAFSRVFLAKEPALGNRQVVLKCSFAGPHEAFILGSLSHPSIVPIFSTRFDESRGLTAISMPVLGRSTLADALNRLAAEGYAARTADVFLSTPSATRLFKATTTDYTSVVLGLIARVCTGLAAAHAAGVVHGDIKPSNVLLSFAGEPMLMDFNLSAGPLGDFERIGGTPPYMAPECLAEFRQARSQTDGPLKLSPRSDLFSLGVVLLELLLGRISFHFDLDRPETLPTEADWLDLACEATRSAHEPRLRQVFNRCLAFDPEQRYANAHEFAQALTTILESQKRTHFWMRRFSMVSAAGAVIGTTVTLWAWNLEDPESLPNILWRTKRHIEREEFREATLLLALAQNKRQDARLMAWSGYCLAMIGHYESAKSTYLAALPFDDRPDIRNNLGYCCAQLRHIEEAEEHFALALEVEPRLQAALHNRANLRRDGVTRGNDLPLPADCWSDYVKAASIGPMNGELSLDAAKAIAFAHLRNQNIDGNLDEFVRVALAAGVNLSAFQGSRFTHEPLDLQLLQNQAKQLRTMAIPRSVPLILPPPFPVPER